MKRARLAKDDANRLIAAEPRNGVAHIYGAAMWDQENTEPHRQQSANSRSSA